MWCPIARQDCHGVDCAWFHEGECAVITLPGLVEKLEDVTDALKDVKRGIDGIAENVVY